MPAAIAKVRPVGRKRVETNDKTYAGRLAARVRELRDERGWNMERLSAATGIPADTLYGYENGRREIPLDALPLLSRAFGLTPAEFFPAYPPKRK